MLVDEEVRDVLLKLLFRSFEHRYRSALGLSVTTICFLTAPCS